MKGFVDPISDTDIMGPAARRFYAPNQWPNADCNDLQNFQPTVQIYFDEMTKLAQKMFSLFSSLLSKDINDDKNLRAGDISGIYSNATFERSQY